MKKLLISLGMLFVLLFGITAASTAMLWNMSPAADLGEGVVLYTRQTTQEGLTVVDEAIYYPEEAPANTVTADRVKQLYHGDTLVGQMVFRVTFAYDGTRVTVQSQELLRAEGFDHWHIRKTKLGSQDGTVTATGRLSKWLVLNIDFAMTLTCDPAGNISCT